MTNMFRIPAIEVRQSAGRTLYSFAIDGKLVPRFATVSRIRRVDDGALSGYQRPEVLSHIEEIRNYLESEAPMVPNAVVIAFDSRVQFTPMPGPNTPYARVGELAIPLEDGAAPETLPGFIVDGQQRLAAIRDAQVDAFPICVSAFITDDVREQTEQFILVNSTKPLPKGLIYELLPSTDTHLPTVLMRRRLPAVLLTRLNREPASPLRGMIQTPTSPEGVIKDNSVLKMLENSLSAGVLHDLQYGGGGDEVDLDAMLGVLFNFWGAVRETFVADWGLPPKRSRLLHGAGVVCLGFLMEEIVRRYHGRPLPTRAKFAKNLEPLRAVCRWSDGCWEFRPGQQRKWNEIQNTSKDISLLWSYLQQQYRTLVWNRHSGKAGPQLSLTE